MDRTPRSSVRAPRIWGTLPRRIRTGRGLGELTKEHAFVIIVALRPTVAETTSVVSVSVTGGTIVAIDLSEFGALFRVGEHRRA